MIRTKEQLLQECYQPARWVAYRVLVLVTKPMAARLKAAADDIGADYMSYQRGFHGGNKLAVAYLAASGRAEAARIASELHDRGFDSEAPIGILREVTEYTVTSYQPTGEEVFNVA